VSSEVETSLDASDPEIIRDSSIPLGMTKGLRAPHDYLWRLGYPLSVEILDWYVKNSAIERSSNVSP
jgi:hypothetical protein